MMAYLQHGIPFVLSAVTLYSLFIVGDKNAHGWLISLCNQALWLVWIILIGAWGLLPMNVGMWYVSYRNWRKWTNERP